MDIPRPEAAREHKFLLLMLIVDILEKNTDSAHPITQKKLLEIIEKQCGFMPSRTTISDDLDRLITAGFPIEKGRKGVYYDGHSLSDGELRFLIDSILYSDLMSQAGASEMIETLASLGSVELQSAVRKQKSRVSLTRKNAHYDFFLTIEYIQQAIHDKKQISCNYITYRPDLTEEQVYAEDIAVNPYDLVYKNGKYYLLGALDDGDQMLSWRVDRLRKVTILKKNSHEIPLMKEISACGGMNKYVETQPDLCGGVVETFKVQCAVNAIDEIVDVFGHNFTVAPEQTDNDDDETIILSVKATRESMKAWAFSHSGSLVVISPESIRKEIAESLDAAKRLYRIAGQPLHYRMYSSNSFERSVEISQKSAAKALVYRSHAHGEYEAIDLSLVAPMTDLTKLFLTDCKLEHPEIISELKMLRILRLLRCQYPAEYLKGLLKLEELEIDSPAALQAMTDHPALKKLFLFGNDIQDISVIPSIQMLKSLSIQHNNTLADCSCLKSADSIEHLEIIDCSRIKDITFLEQMKSLKELHIDNRFYSVEDGIRLHEKRGINIHFHYQCDIDAETLKILRGDSINKPALKKRGK